MRERSCMLYTVYFYLHLSVHFVSFQFSTHSSFLIPYHVFLISLPIPYIFVSKVDSLRTCHTTRGVFFKRPAYGLPPTTEYSDGQKLDNFSHHSSQGKNATKTFSSRPNSPHGANLPHCKSGFQENLYRIYKFEGVRA